ncbi:MAG: hypothetical protein RLZ22_217 [Verrucomicrobiota bacterium]|jgi:hypothetical protein
MALSKSFVWRDVLGLLLRNLENMPWQSIE